MFRILFILFKRSWFVRNVQKQYMKIFFFRTSYSWHRMLLKRNVRILVAIAYSTFSLFSSLKSKLWSESCSHSRSFHIESDISNKLIKCMTDFRIFRADIQIRKFLTTFLSMLGEGKASQCYSSLATERIVEFPYGFPFSFKKMDSVTL